MSRLIIVEGTDCSGKETQTNLLIERLKQEKANIEKFGFPMYGTPTGDIVGGPYLGKKHISEGYFPEGAANVDPKVSACYFTADRQYNAHKITDLLNNGTDVLLDRYVESNLAHQGGKLSTSKERLEMYKWLRQFEYGFMKLPRPDLIIFLYVPYQYALKLKENREEEPDQHEASKEHLINAENAYLELSKRYGYYNVDCIKNDSMRSKSDINDEIYTIVKEKSLKPTSRLKSSILKYRP